MTRMPVWQAKYYTFNIYSRRKLEEKLAYMAEANKKRKLVRFLPSEKLVTRWVEHARKLPRKITY